ncbi:hypothetical protein A6M13_00540 [Caryophanon tenue]|uniref:Uncharacterized protein n=1 Tax=Caryophanon tenue TaxID=33978 RepID=A0A1C0YMG4_9BACL|nr:hypothetical protein A6M13_00540 [Caryophanon tenue]
MAGSFLKTTFILLPWSIDGANPSTSNSALTVRASFKEFLWKEEGWHHEHIRIVPLLDGAFLCVKSGDTPQF